MKVNTALMTTLASVNANSVNSLDICEATYQGINERVLACPGGRINIISAEYGRPGDDRETCCANAKKCWVKSGDQCTADATEWVNTKCNGESECTLFGNMNGILDDPCRKRHKFLNVQYECDYESPVVTASFCEAQLDNRTNNIVCANEGEVISVRSATWGRGKDAYCCPNKQESKCLADQCSGETDATELMSLRCDGETSCTWDASIADEIVDPCSDVFKYMTVDYECAVPTTPAPMMDQFNGIGFNAGVTGESCTDVMNAAFDYYATLQVATKGDKTHHGRFEADGFTGEGGVTYNKRINLFKANMQKWGRKLTNNGCDCGNDNAATIQVYTSRVNTSSNPTVNYTNVNAILSRMSSLLTCEQKTDKMSAGVTRKMKHAKQILTGHSPTGSVIKKRHQNWQSFMN